MKDIENKAKDWGLKQREAEIKLLQEGIVPERYLRNMGTLGLKGQISLLESQVAVIGAGGLGGTIIEMLARLGVGKLICVDGDVFAEHNLNRQILSQENNLGQSKVKVAEERVKGINKAVEFQGYPIMLTAENAETLLKGCQVVVDALDNLPDRFLLEEKAKKLGIPLVHGAIAGFTGQVATVFPEDEGLKLIYKKEGKKGIEEELGNPAATPGLAASWEVQEVVKIITVKGTLLRNKLLYFDAEMGIVEIFSLANNSESGCENANY